jgi:hypothetical protein
MKCERPALKSTRNGVCGLKFAFAPVSRLLEGERDGLVAARRPWIRTMVVGPEVVMATSLRMPRRTSLGGATAMAIRLGLPGGEPQPDDDQSG